MISSPIIAIYMSRWPKRCVCWIEAFIAEILAEISPQRLLVFIIRKYSYRIKVSTKHTYFHFETSFTDLQQWSLSSLNNSPVTAMIVCFYYQKTYISDESIRKTHLLWILKMIHWSAGDGEPESGPRGCWCVFRGCRENHSSPGRHGKLCGCEHHLWYAVEVTRLLELHISYTSHLSYNICTACSHHSNNASGPLHLDVLCLRMWLGPVLLFSKLN